MRSFVLFLSFALTPLFSVQEAAPVKIDSGTSDGAEAALRKFSVAPGLQVDLWAAEPHALITRRVTGDANYTTITFRIAPMTTHAKVDWKSLPFRVRDRNEKRLWSACLL